VRVLHRNDTEEGAGGSTGHYKRFLSIVILVFGIAMFCNLALSTWNLGKLTADARRFCSLIDRQVAAASQIAGPKLLFIGGSNLRQGLSAQRISETISVPSFNFGLQAGLGARLILFEAKKVLRSGDTAMLVLEYNHYIDDRWNEVSSDVLFGCGEEYFRQMGLLGKFEALLSITSWRVFEALVFGDNATTQDRERPSNADRAVMLRYGDRAPSETDSVDETTRRRLQLYQPIPISIKTDAEGPEAIASFINWARSRDIKVVATWPNTIYFPAYELASGFLEITDFYKNLGVPVIGRPQDAMYPTDLFNDTLYHLNSKGISQRTNDVISMINANHWLLPARMVKDVKHD
jgi:hypothetical protein